MKPDVNVDAGTVMDTDVDTDMDTTAETGPEDVSAWKFQFL